MNDIRIAAVVFHSLALNPERNLDRMLRWIKAAKERGAELICFPELNISGYSPDREIARAAEPVPGPTTVRLLEWAEAEKIVILAGMAEKDENGRIFASHLVVDPGGGIGVYRKLHIPPPERNIFAAGEEISLFDAGGVKFGIQLCYDAHFPQLSTAMAAGGADIIFLPHASPRGSPAEKYRSWLRHMPARAYDNSLFVVACNQVGQNGKGLTFPGVALIIDPSGRVREKTLAKDETMIVSDLRACDMRSVRENSMRFFLPNTRPELYAR